MAHSIMLHKPTTGFGLSRRWLAALAPVLLCLGCATAPEIKAPPLEPPRAFTGSGDAPLTNTWWTAFGDPSLDALVDLALSDNFEINRAWLRLREARAAARIAGAERIPSLDLEAGGERVERDDTVTERLELGLVAGYELDLWGRVRSASDAERLRADATAAEIQAAALTLSAEIARTWFAFVESHARLALLHEQEAANAKVVRLLENRFAAGQTRAVDVLRQRQLAASTREARAAAEAEAATLGHQLAVLLGRNPSEGPGVVPGRLPALPPLPDTGLPADLIRRRPDVRAAFLQLTAANRDTAAAVSDRFPRISLFASATTVEEGAEALFEDWATTLAANLVAPLIDGGRRRAAVDAARAREAQLVFAYGQALLDAFREVEDALARETAQRERIHALEEQVDLAERAYRQLGIEYANGVSNFIDVLTALTEAQELRRDLLQARREALEIRIGLYRALAGGLAEQGEDSA